MTFTDEDLKEYKERAIQLDRQHTLNLIARLEAAEKAITMARAVILNGADEALHEPLSKAYAESMSAWRKAAGK